jgi:hypothetical protein
MAMYMRKVVFWDLVVATCSLFSRRDSPALKMEAIRSSETSVLTTTTRHQIPEDDFLHILIMSS